MRKEILKLCQRTPCLYEYPFLTGSSFKASIYGKERYGFRCAFRFWFAKWSVNGSTSVILALGWFSIFRFVDMIGLNSSTSNVYLARCDQLLQLICVLDDRRQVFIARRRDHYVVLDSAM